VLYWYDVLYGGEYFLELCEINKTKWFVWFELHKWNLEVGWGEWCCIGMMFYMEESDF